MRRRLLRRSRVSNKSTILASAFYSQVDLIMGYNGHVNQQGSHSVELHDIIQSPPHMQLLV